MIKICNYLDIPSEKKDAVLEQVLQIGFCPAYGKQKTMKREMEKSQPGIFPQYIFVFREHKLIGYMFLIENKNDFDVKVHLITDGEEHVGKIEDGGVEVFYPIVKNTEYRLGCHADVSEGTEIKLVVYDGEE